MRTKPICFGFLEYATALRTALEYLVVCQSARPQGLSPKVNSPRKAILTNRRKASPGHAALIGRSSGTASSKQPAQQGQMGRAAPAGSGRSLFEARLRRVATSGSRDVRSVPGSLRSAPRPSGGSVRWRPGPRVWKRSRGETRDQK